MLNIAIANLNVVTVYINDVHVLCTRLVIRVPHRLPLAYPCNVQPNHRSLEDQTHLMQRGDNGSSKRQQPHRPQVPGMTRHQLPDLPG